MKFALLSLAAAGALAFSAGTAFAGPPGQYHGGHHGGYSSFRPVGPHLDYHHGHYHYHNGFYRSGPVAPVYPSYSYPTYGYGSGFNITIGSGVAPYYGGGYYGGGYYGRRW